MAEFKKELIKATGKDREKLEREYSELAKEADKFDRQNCRRVIICEDPNNLDVIRSLVRHGQLAIMSPDGRSVIDALNGKAGNLIRELLIRGYCLEDMLLGKPYTSNSYCVIREPLSCCLVFVQPDKIKEMLSNPRLTNDGTIGRTLFVDQVFSKSVKPGTPVSTDLQSEWIENCKSLFEDCQSESNDTPREYKLEGDALCVLMTFEAGNVKKMDETKFQHVLDVFKRRVEHVRKLVLILHVLKHVGAKVPECIMPDTVRDAIQVEEWFFSNLFELREDAAHEEEIAAQQKILRKLELVPEGISLRDIQRKCRLPSAKAVRHLMGQLVAEGKVEHRISTPEGGGTPSPMYKTIMKG